MRADQTRMTSAAAAHTLIEIRLRSATSIAPPMARISLCAELAHAPGLELAGSEQPVAGGVAHLESVAHASEPIHGLAARDCFIAGSAIWAALPLWSAGGSKRKRDGRNHSFAVSQLGCMRKQC
jgi:hypothetical protein